MINKIRKLTLSIMMGILLGFTSLNLSSFAMEDEDLPKGKFLIKSTYSGEFLYDHNTGEFAWVYARNSVSKESVFTMEKRDEGILIKNLSTGNYLYSKDLSNRQSCASNREGDELNFNFRTILGHRNIKSNSYFDIIKRGTGYVIKSKRHSDYVFIGPFMPGDHGRDGHFVIANNSINNTGYFTFIPYNFELF